MVAAIASAVVGAVVGAVIKTVLEQIVKIVDSRFELSKEFRENIDYIKRNLEYIAAEEADRRRRIAGKGHTSNVMSISMKETRDLAHDIEDCLDKILRYYSKSKHGAVRRAMFPPYADKVEQLKKRLEDANKRKRVYNVDGSQPLAQATPEDAGSTNMIEPVGIDEPKKEILNLLTDIVEDQLKVISIVGFGGSGKSTLAKAVHDCPETVLQFPARAFILASEYKGNSKGLLMALLQELCPAARGAGDTQQQLQTKIYDYLNTTRCLIVLDDIEEQQWDNIKSSFPQKTRSRIIVTTAFRPLARRCSNHGKNGYVYDMRTLDEKHSKKLLEAVLKNNLPVLEQSSTTLIVSKCDGHPLALVSVANYLLGRSEFTEKDCKYFWREGIGSRMEEDYVFGKLKQILMSNYLTLPGRPDLETCLLYISVFPNGHPIRRSSLVRRWFAEGYVNGVDLADQNIEELIERDIIRDIDQSRISKVKTCRAHGIMHEFLRQESMTARFITYLCHPERSKYRHLFVEDHHSTSYPDKKENLRAHSLTISGSATEAVEYLAKCELLRVLDLEKCNDLKDKHIDGISELWHLRYLSLGENISRLPKNIEKLHCLETLDVRKATEAITLPVEVIKLPYLAHLLGKFKLEKKNWKNRKAKRIIPKECNLQTLAGFIIDDDDTAVFPMLMKHMENLQKVKAWCNSDSKELLVEIEKFVQAGMGTGDRDYSLSLYLGENLTKNFLRSLKSSLNGYLSSLKIRGALGALDGLTQSIRGLKVLCLSSENDMRINANDLSNLGGLICLQYLKLVKVSLGGLVIGIQHFRALSCLCLVQSRLILPSVQDGALLKLVSLQLLAEDLDNLPSFKIEQRELLKEVSLDSRVNKKTKTDLENAAQKHPNRPRVLYLDRVDPGDTGSKVKYVAARRPESETGSSVVQEEQQIRVHEETKTTSEDEAQNHPKRRRALYVDRVDAKRPALETISSCVLDEQQIPVEPSSDIELISSALEQTTVSDQSLVSAELCSSGDTEMPSSSRVVSRPILEKVFRTFKRSTLS